VKRRILIVGAGGQARVVLSVLARLPGWKACGILDRGRQSIGEAMLGCRVVGSFADLAAWRKRGVRHAFVAIGDNEERGRLFRRVRDEGFEVPALVHPAARLEAGATVGSGTLVCVGALLGTLAAIGENCIVNTGAIVDHETRVGAGSHVAPGGRIGGRVEIGAGVCIGIGASVRDRIQSGYRTVVGAGSVVVRSLPAKVVAYGVPARKRRRAP